MDEFQSETGDNHGLNGVTFDAACEHLERLTRDALREWLTTWGDLPGLHAEAEDLAILTTHKVLAALLHNG